MRYIVLVKGYVKGEVDGGVVDNIKAFVLAIDKNRYFLRKFPKWKFTNNIISDISDFNTEI